MADTGPSSFPLSAGVLLGVGLGGFFDGIMLHQILQWHHMLTSAGYPADSVRHLEINTLFDGLFHALTYGFVVAGLILFWRAARSPHQPWSVRRILGGIMIGFGLFNLVEGIINHQMFGLHHVNETVPRAQWLYWDLGFLASGVALVVAGWILSRSPKNQAKE
jgi:uncharacterized membrane protein